MVTTARYPGLVTCSDCGFLTFSSSLTDDELLELYGRDYFHGAEYLDYAREEDSLRSNFRDRLQEIEAVKGDLSAARLLEVGCAYGYFLKEAGEKVAKARGLDLSAHAVAIASEVQNQDVAVGDYLDYSVTESLDIICLWDVIEHLRRPDAVVAKAAADLAPGGILCITTGDVGSFNARMRGAKWRMIHPPTHLHYFSARTLTMMLHEKGLEVISLTYPGVTRSFGMIFHGILAMRLGRPDLYSKIKNLSLMKVRINLNLRDIMFVIARKPELPPN